MAAKGRKSITQKGIKNQIHISLEYICKHIEVDSNAINSSSFYFKVDRLNV
jgi:hypothetical protein